MMKRLLYVGLLAVCSCFWAGCSQPAPEPEPETEAEMEATMEDQQSMMEAEMEETPPAE